MEKLFRNAAVIAAGAIVTAILAPVLAKGLTPSPSPGFAPDDACLANAKPLALAVAQYAQDWDGFLPATDTQAHFQAALLPYVGRTSAFTCPATHLAYVPNPAISGHSIFEYRATEDTTIVFQDAAPHPSHKSTVGFLDGHVEQGGVEAGDPDQLCVDHVKAISLAVLQYVQDNDERYPLLDSPDHAKTALMPYVTSARMFICPATGQPYVFNASLSYVAFPSIASPTTTIVMQDAIAHSNGVKTIGYADGHVTPAPTASDPGAADTANLRQIGFGVTQYVQDYDEFYPSFQNEPAFETAVGPYTRNPSIFINPNTGQNYLLNASLSGRSLASLDAPSMFWMAKDRAVNPDGSFNTLTADGRVSTRYSCIPIHISVGADNETRLLWGRADGQAVLSFLSLSGDEQWRGYLGSGLGTARGIVTAPSGMSTLLFSTPNSATVLGVNVRGGVVQKSQFGPYDGWGVKGVAVGGNGLPRLLWRRYDKSWAIWQMSAAGDYTSDVRFGPFTGISDAVIAAGADNALTVGWKQPGDDVALWRLSSSAVYQSALSLRVNHTRQLVATTVDPNNVTWLLWAGTTGATTLDAYNSQNTLVNHLDLGVDAGWTARDLGVGADGNLRILWTSATGSGRLRVLTSAGSVLSTHDFSPF
ncbi:hypothetical protein CCAX7_58330 [Capsulimonas corticalis]|uniref:Uncharacterized protein n=1 Tax=Capsulimonas corticalis TaxID=2219043 RepID=A0A402D055_9BACT|nr:hypothetical protein [Capsulimonas corticalis]BDI33782.1 hypothetical protein CCAX7_58330 [Capsulimonas corticalis]